ncbi:hypothetical protein K435DRAFT_842453, partial [Dendrothele bispora CBS 962.96]
MPSQTRINKGTLILITGKTGVGRTRFITHCTGEYASINNSLDPAGQVIECFPVPNVKHSSLPVILVDIPGFDHSDQMSLSDYQIFDKIKDWLANSCHKRVLVAGIVYLHDLTEDRPGEMQALGILSRSVPTGHLMLATTKPSHKNLSDEEYNRRHNLLLEVGLWKEVIDKGAQVRNLNLQARLLPTQSALPWFKFRVKSLDFRLSFTWVPAGSRQ